MPYETLIAAGLPDAIMTGHIVNDTIDPGVPASLSVATVEGLLRGRLGWTGAVITDDLGAEAITSRYTQRRGGGPRPRGGQRPAPVRQPDGLCARPRREARRRRSSGSSTSGRITEARIDESIDRLDVLAFGAAIE